MPPPKSRGGGNLSRAIRPPLHSISTPNLPTLSDFGMVSDAQLGRGGSSSGGGSGGGGGGGSGNNNSGNSSNTQPGRRSGDGGQATSPLALSPSDAYAGEDDDAAAAGAGAGAWSSEERRTRENAPPEQTLQQRRQVAHRAYSSANIQAQQFAQPSPSQLYPPFYGRPTTPLPPSPSLTSLLRPPFSTHTSRHTTPESSDVESSVAGGLSGASAAAGSTAAAVEKSAAAALPVPRATPKVPTYEYYGFALYLASSAALLMYVLWAYLPSPFLHQLGIHYYPNRWWALAIPAWIVMLLVYIYVALASYNTGALTLPMASLENLVDDASMVAVVDREGRIVRPKKASRFGGTAQHSILLHKNAGSTNPGTGRHSRQSSAGRAAAQASTLGKDVDWKTLWNEGTDAVMDIPIGGVCEILYGAGRQADGT